MRKSAACAALVAFSGVAWGVAGQTSNRQGEVPPPDLPAVAITGDPDNIHLDALRKCESLPGYGDLRQEFTIEQVMQGSINRIEESLFTVLRTESGKSLDVAWWLNPIVDGKPRYSWWDFLARFHRADEVLSQHGWLANWKAAAPGHELELHAFGLEPEADADDIEFFVLPVWREAGFVGDPEFEVLARRGDTSWVQLFFNETDPRILVTYSMDPPDEPKHWLDSLDVQFHPRCKQGEKSSRYAVIERNGTWHVHEYSKCAP